MLIGKMLRDVAHITVGFHSQEVNRGLIPCVGDFTHVGG